MNDNIYERVSRIEAHENLRLADTMEVLEKSYKNACDAMDDESAMMFARKIRDELLSESDKEVMLDRMNFDTSSATKFIASLVEALKGGWAKYRQALRDLPEQAGFPFKIDWPTRPDEKQRGSLR